MANKSKAKGTRFETRVVKFLATYGLEAKRKALAGNEDRGDIEVEGKWMLEVKAGKQTANPSRTQLTEWMRQTQVEEKNSGQPGWLVVARANRAIADADVYQWCANGWLHQYLDEFAEDLVKRKETGF